ncbi:MAG: glycosyltransferase family 39 protein [Gemmataceae bacterium]
MQALDSSTLGRRRLEALAVVLICTGCLAPFVNKAFTIDDPLFLWTAQHIQRHPLDPYGFEVNWYISPERMADVTKNPPLACYALALAGFFFGWSEIALHMVFLLPAAGAAWGTYRLAEGLCGRPLLATLAAVLTPVFLVSSSNVMCDTMMLCLWVWAIVCWRRGLDRPGWLIVAAILIGLCALTKYFGASLIPLLFAYTLLSRQRLLAGVAALLIPILLLTVYQLATLRMYNSGLLLDAVGFSVGARELYGQGWRTPLIGLAFTGGCLAGVVFFLPLLWPRRTLLLFGVLSALLALPLGAARGWEGSFLLQAALFVLGGVAVVALAAADWRRCRDADGWLLLLWTAGTLTFSIGVNWVINARSLLPLAPAAGILIARRFDWLRGPAVEPAAWREAWPLAPAAVVALLVADMDRGRAEADRDAARLVAESTFSQQGTLWFEGHWGFQYYLQNRGGAAVDQDEVPLHFHKDDFLALPGENTGVNWEPPAETVYAFQTIDEALSPLGCTMNRHRGAGFYSHDHGPLPFVFGSAATQRYRLLRFAASIDDVDDVMRRDTHK